jgi:hypothetical protein
VTVRNAFTQREVNVRIVQRIGEVALVQVPNLAERKPAQDEVKTSRESS